MSLRGNLGSKESSVEYLSPIWLDRARRPRTSELLGTLYCDRKARITNIALPKRKRSSLSRPFGDDRFLALKSDDFMKGDRRCIRVVRGKRGRVRSGLVEMGCSLTSDAQRIQNDPYL